MPEIQKLENPRKYGAAPFRTVLVHGGPGAGGEMEPVCHRLAETGVSSLEPIQTALSVRGQLEELKNAIETEATAPVFLIGFSWGAWLSFLLASEYPGLVKKLILLSSGSFDEEYVKDLHSARMARLSEEEKQEIDSLAAILDNPAEENKSAAFRRFGELFSKTDTFEPIEEIEKCAIDFRPDIYNAVWPEAAELRKSGRLMELCSKIKCPLVAIHGDSDPHSSAGVKIPLASALSDFRFILLEKCGHKPWGERYAATHFYEVLREEISRT